MEVKPKIVLVVDDPAWAFAISANDMVKHMTNFDFTIIDYYNGRNKEKSFFDQFDLVYLFGHFMDEWMPKDFDYGKSCTGIRAQFGYTDDQFKPEQDPQHSKKAQGILKYPAIHVVSEILYDKFKSFHPNCSYICHGVDINHFVPKKSYKKGKKLILGWAGNPGNTLKNIKLLRDVVGQRSDAILKEARFQNGQLDRNEMLKFYHSIDAYILPSATEGMSATILEAMACGLPIIATPVGGWIELLHKSGGGYFVNPTKESIDNTIDKMISMSEGSMHSMGLDNRMEICNSWSWEQKAEEFTVFFNDAIEQSKSRKITEAEENQTLKCFSSKWETLENYGFSEEQGDFFREWTIKKYGLKREQELCDFFESKKNILEVGIGSGFNLNYISGHNANEIIGVDISNVAVEKAKKFFKDHACVTILKANLMNLPFDDNYFDLIIADGVLHHTENTKDALFAIYKKLQKGGHLYAYLYKEMGAIREFTNNWIKEKVLKLTPEQCIEYCQPITELGKQLSEIKKKIELPKIDILGLPEGKYTVQEIFYYGILKCFWNDKFSFHENNMNNYDWFYPEWAWRQSKEKVEEWLKELDCEYQFNDANLNGLSILLKRIG